MGNLKNYNFNKLDAFLSNSEYYDFYIAQDEYSSHAMYNGIISGSCFVVHYDFNEGGIYSTGSTSADTIYSLVTWSGATNIGHTFSTFGLTGIDNGYLTYNKTSGDTSNTALTQTITGSTVIISSADTRLTLTRVTGLTETYEYPVEVITDNSILGDYSKLCGGFYQGYYKLDGYDYEVLPTRVPKAWTAEVWLRKPSTDECPPITTTITSAITCDTFYETSETFVVPSYQLIGTNNISGTVYDTYRLYLDGTGSTSSGLHTIYGNSGNTMVFPPAYNEPSPFGTDIGGMSTAFFPINPNSEWDSWLTVGLTDGNITSELSSVGLDFSTHWGSGYQTSLSGSSAAVFWLDPNSGPLFSSGRVCVAQITIPTGTTFNVKLNAQGRSVSGEDWYQEDIEFTNGTPSTPQSPLPSGRVCYNDRADTDNSGSVSVTDINNVLTAQGGSIITYPNEDINEDGILNVDDLQLVLNAVGNSIPLPTSTYNVDIEITGTTLNDTYPDNKGFFFYMGTRAENKYWNIFDGVNSGCTSGCTSDTGCTGTVTTNCTIPKETDISFIDDDGHKINLSPPPIVYREIDNQFLIYGQADNGPRCGNCGSGPSGFGNKTVCNFSGGSITVSGYTQVVSNTQNPFLIYGQASNNPRCGNCGGPVSGYGNKTVCDFSGMTKPMLELDKDIDIIDNAIGFRIKDDGSIGYRALKMTGTCSGDTYISGVTVEEQYSASGMVMDDQWEHVAIRFVMPEYDDCELKYGKPRKGRLMFYVNCKLKFVAEEVDEFIAKRLNEHKDKQLGVPFNISLGGGSQGLLESMTFDGQDPEDLGLKIQENYAGTFIGDISQFRFYICDLNWCDLQNNCEVEKKRYGK